MTLASNSVKNCISVPSTLCFMLQRVGEKEKPLLALDYIILAFSAQFEAVVVLVSNHAMLIFSHHLGLSKHEGSIS